MKTPTSFPKAPLAALGATLLLAACAATPSTKTADATTAKVLPCVSTGSAIPGNACSGIGESYSRADIDRTGATNTADALRMLSPSVTVTH